MDPQQPKIKSCSKCGSSFECMHNAEYWCMEYEISPVNLKTLQQTYADCLCPGCLEKYSSGRKQGRESKV
jgi:ribosomal protein L34E